MEPVMCNQMQANSKSIAHREAVTLTFTMIQLLEHKLFKVKQIRCFFLPSSSSSSPPDTDVLIFLLPLQLFSHFPRKLFVSGFEPPPCFLSWIDWACLFVVRIYKSTCLIWGHAAVTWSGKGVILPHMQTLFGSSRRPGHALCHNLVTHLRMSTMGQHKHERHIVKQLEKPPQGALCGHMARACDRRHF